MSKKEFKDYIHNPQWIDNPVTEEDMFCYIGLMTGLAMNLIKNRNNSEAMDNLIGYVLEMGERMYRTRRTHDIRINIDEYKIR